MGIVVIDNLQTLCSVVTFTLLGNSSTKTRFTLNIRRIRRFFHDIRVWVSFHWRCKRAQLSHKLQRPVITLMTDVKCKSKLQCFFQSLTDKLKRHWRQRRMIALLSLYIDIYGNTLRGEAEDGVMNGCLIESTRMIGRQGKMFLEVAYCSLRYACTSVSRQRHVQLSENDSGYLGRL